MGNELGWPHCTGPRFAEDGTRVADGLLDWAGILYPGWTPADIQQYFNRGTFVDAACNLLGQRQKLHPETIARAEKEGWDGFIEAYQHFQDNEQWEMALCAEPVVNNQDRYVGTLDQTGTLGGSTPALIDIKTGTAPSWTGLQTAAYDLALNGTRMKRFALELHADGTYRLVSYANPLDYNKVRILARAYWISREYA